MPGLIPLTNMTVKHEYSAGNWQDFTGDLAQASLVLREFAGTHTGALSFYRANMDPSQSSATTVVKKGDRVRVWMKNPAGTLRKTGTFQITKVAVAIDLTKPAGFRNKVTINLIGLGVAGVGGSGGSSGVASLPELSNVITGAKFEINGNTFALRSTYAWSGTANASSSTETDTDDNVRTNLAQSPGMEDAGASAGWVVNAGNTVAKDTTTVRQGTKSLKYTIANENYGYHPMDGSTVNGITSPTRVVGTTYTASVYVFTATAQNLCLMDYGTSNTAGPTVAVPANTWTRLTVTFTAGTNVFLSVRVPGRATAVVGPLYLDSFLVEATGTVGAYFDGSTPSNVSGITSPSSGALLRTNRATNPSFETNITGWTAGGSVPPTLAQSAVRAFSGTKSLLVTWGTGGTLPLASHAVSGLTIGRTYTFSAYVYVPTGNPNVSIAVAGMGFGPNTAGQVDQWVRLTQTITATATSHTLQLVGSSPTSGQVAYVDAAMVEEAPAAGPYFDGATVADGHTYAWTGTAGASTSTDTGTYTEAISVDTASERDQIILTRDSNAGAIVFEDPAGIIQIYDPAGYRTGLPGLTVTSSNYSKVDVKFDLAHVINVVQFRYLEKIKTGNKATRVKEHNVTFKDNASVAKYGPRKKVITTHKKSNFTAHANAIFAANADPEPVPTSVTIPVRTAADLLPGYEDGTYVGHKIGVTLPDGVTSYVCRIASIVHDIAPDKWIVTIGLRAQATVQVPHPPSRSTGGAFMGTEVANTPDGTVLSAHIEDAIDGTGKSLTNATVQTDTGGNRIVMRDDGSEGVIEFFSGDPGETNGQINPGVNAGQHSILFETSRGSAAPYNVPGIINLLGSAPGVANGLVNIPQNDVRIGPSGGKVTITAATGAIDALGNITAGVGSGAVEVAGDALRSRNPPTTTGTANVLMGASGLLNKITSLSRHKLDQEPLDLAAVAGVLDLTPATWYDRAEVEAAGGTEGLCRIPGLIAEDVAAHAPALALYDGEGELQGVAYDRVAALLIPLVRDLSDRVQALERALADKENP